jgi:DnaK suppressor protein
MGNQAPIFSADYLDRKRRELTRLREALGKIADNAEAEETEIKTESSLQAHESEDDGQRLDRLELEGNLVRRDISRLARVERALEKIAEGTYGLSDISGERIPESRLEAMPEAINTVAEQEASEVSR